jgi:hypothetical protein
MRIDIQSTHQTLLCMFFNIKIFFNVAYFGEDILTYIYIIVYCNIFISDKIMLMIFQKYSQKYSQKHSSKMMNVTPINLFKA